MIYRKILKHFHCR